ncbi:MAG: hypothetical protein JNM56_20595 [Planctomycetia bacterium]|nr:hypothetical protein [Planctomycetia bacterium]
MPSDAHWIASLDVRAFAGAPLVKTHLAATLKQWFADEPTLRELRQALPFDPLADLDRATLAGPLPPQAGRGALILRGRFDLTKLHAAAERYAKQEPRAFRIHTEEQRAVYEFTEDGRAGLPLWISFPDQGTLLCTPSRRQLSELLDRKGNTPPTLSKELTALLATVDGQQTAWLAAVATPELKKMLGTSPETEKLFQTVQHLSGGLTVGAGVQLSFVLQTNQAATASELRKFLEGAQAILSLAAMDSKTNAPLLGFLVSSIKLGSVKDAVLIRAAVTKEQLDKVAK